MSLTKKIEARDKAQQKAHKARQSASAWNSLFELVGPQKPMRQRREAIRSLDLLCIACEYVSPGMMHEVLRVFAQLESSEFKEFLRIYRKQSGIR